MVVGSPVDMGREVKGTRFAERLARLDHLFRRQAKDAWMQKVKEFLKTYLTVKAAAQAAAEAPAQAPPEAPRT